MRAMADPAPRVAYPPSKPLLVYDGECAFCKLWIARWKEETGNAVEYESLQEAAARFADIPREEFERAVKLIEPDGSTYSGAEAVYRSLGAGGRPLNRWGYDHVPGFGAASEFAYRVIANHRALAHRVTRLFWGNDVRRPTYFTSRSWFLRSLGIIFLIAFLSFWLQIDGLIGERGIMPLPQLMEAARTQLGGRDWLVLPTLCWINSSNVFLHFLCGTGAVLSAFLIAEIAPILSLVLIVGIYLSLSVAGQTFLSFQWDILLIETGFLAIFIATWRWWPRRGEQPDVSRPALFLLQFLLFKLILMSGVVKLTSGDPSWWDLSALDYHYWTQPLPTVAGWWADKSPEWVKHFCTAATLVIEVVVPFLIWGPRRLRQLACGLFVLLQVVIGLTGNYAFFNLLTIALCLLLIDDAIWPPAFRLRGGLPVVRRRPGLIPALVIFVTMPINAVLILDCFKPNLTWPRAMESLYTAITPFRIVNSYGLFRVMTKERPEIIIEGSDNGLEWKPYQFKWKAGDLDRPPLFVEPHQPRLDWQMWFAALGDPRQNPWFLALAQRLLEGSPDVLALLGKNPFPEKPPRYLRARIYRYHFTSLAEYRRTGHWWERSDALTYLPEVSLSGE